MCYVVGCGALATVQTADNGLLGDTAYPWVVRAGAAPSQWVADIATPLGRAMQDKPAHVSPVQVGEWAHTGGEIVSYVPGVAGTVVGKVLDAGGPVGGVIATLGTQEY